MYEIRVAFLLAKSVFIYFLPQVDNSTVENRRIAYLMLDDAFFSGETLLNFDNIWLPDMVIKHLAKKVSIFLLLSIIVADNLVCT